MNYTRTAKSNPEAKRATQPRTHAGKKMSKAEVKTNPHRVDLLKRHQLVGRRRKDDQGI